MFCIVCFLFTLYLYRLGKMVEVLLFYAGDILLICLSLIYLKLLLYAVECELDWLDLWINLCWRRSIVGRTPVLAGELPLSCVRLLA